MRKSNTFRSMGYRYEDLSTEETINLCHSIKEGMRSEKGSALYQTFIAARNRLVEANLALVVSWLKRHPQGGLHDAQDMIQEGCVGVIEAAIRFNPCMGTKFSTYAVFWIQQAILKFVKEDACFSVKQSAWNAKGLVDQARRRLEKAGKPIDPESLLKESGLSVARFKSAAKCGQRTLLDTDRQVPISYTSSHEDDVDDRDTADYRRDALSSAFDRIDVRQAHVLRRRFSVGCEHGLQREISQEIGVGKDTVGRMERDGLDAMTRVLGGTERCD